ncbi:MAG: ABC transporter ATP-binding protein/permease [Bacteroidia bacterium]|nr:ABC transporter ATP-binding protein/permease [Bacteroidia bacterium]
MKTVIRILRYVLPYKRNLALSSVAMFFSVIFNMVTVILIIPFINILFDKTRPTLQAVPAFSLENLKTWSFTQMNNLMASTDPVTALRTLCLLIIGAFVLKNVFHYVQSWFMAPAEQGIIRDLRQNLYEHMNRLSLSYFTEEKKGLLMSRIISDVQLVNDSAIAVVNSLFRDPPQILVYTILLFVIDWELTLLVLLLIPTTGFILTRLGNWVKRESGKLQESIARITSVLDEGLSSMRIIKAFRTEAYETGRFRRENEQYFRTFVNIKRRREIASPITEILSVLVVVLILWFMGDSILTGRSTMSSGVFVAYIFAMLQMMQPLKYFGQTINQIAQGMAGAQRVFQVLDIEPRITDKPGALHIAGFKDRIVYERVHFRYDTGEEVLSGIDAEIRAGEVIAIVGPSGVGKSTMVDLVPRFYDVTGGRMLIDGTDVRDISVQSLRRLMGIVTQETFLFNTSIRENIAYGEDNAPMDRIIAAAKAANAHEFISETPQGYETIIGDRGVKLSGGQRQRLSIARAIYKNPPILILDEATSSLDTESEVLVQNAIENLMQGRTSIVIAHRLSTIKRADRIYVLDTNGVAEVGTHEELLSRGGLYHKLYQLQFQL